MMFFLKILHRILNLVLPEPEIKISNFQLENPLSRNTNKIHFKKQIFSMKSSSYQKNT